MTKPIAVVLALMLAVMPFAAARADCPDGICPDGSLLLSAQQRPVFEACMRGRGVPANRMRPGDPLYEGNVWQCMNQVHYGNPDGPDR